MRMRAMKRYLIPILIPLVLVSVLLSGCNGVSSSEPKASDYQQRIAELEQQVAALTKQVQELSNENRLQPRVIEKDIEIPNSARLVYYWLPFYLKAGDRVEGEVSITFYNTVVSGNRMYSKVEDPYGNILVETSHVAVAGGGAVDDFPRVNPWRLTFIAATDGEYKLGVSFPTGLLNAPAASVAHLKIVVNP